MILDHCRLQNRAGCIVIRVDGDFSVVLDHNYCYCLSILFDYQMSFYTEGDLDHIIVY